MKCIHISQLPLYKKVRHVNNAVFKQLKKDQIIFLFLIENITKLMKFHDNKEQANKNLQKRYYGSMYVSTEKKKHNVEVENYVLLGGQI